MALRQFRPMTPGTRQLITVDRSGLWKGEPEKKLTEGLKKTGGRNFVPGVVTNPNGRPKTPPELKALRRLTKAEFELV